MNYEPTRIGPEVRDPHRMKSAGDPTLALLAGVAGIFCAMTGLLFLIWPVHSNIYLLGGLMAFALTGIALSLILLARHRAPERQTEPASDAAPSLSARPIDHLVSLLNVSRAIGSGASSADLGQVIVDSCLDCFESDEASLMMVDRPSGDLVVTSFAGHREPSVVRNARVPMGQSVAGKVALTRIPLILGPDIDIKQFPGFRVKKRPVQYAMVAPIVVRNRVVGVLNVSTRSLRVRYNEDDLRVLCILAEHAGIVAAKARDGERVLRLVRRVRRRMRAAHPSVRPAPIVLDETRRAA
jgi:putative methionine-R-sulfoxide reductase with GAF domain